MFGLCPIEVLSRNGDDAPWTRPGTEQFRVITSVAFYYDGHLCGEYY